MSNKVKFCNVTLILVFLCQCFLMALAGCMQQRAKAQPTPLPPDCPPCPSEAMRIDALSNRNQALDKDLKACQVHVEALSHQAALMEIRLLQKDALANDLMRRAAGQQKRLDEAITEVVRTKAKLRSIESKAEAASTIAEAELSIESMKNRFDARELEKMAEFQKAEGLLRQSTRELNVHNYGGALYLAVQAKSQADAGKRIIQNRDAYMPAIGEIVFEQTLSLILTKNTNLREGPDTTFQIVRTLKQGTAIVGYAYRGNWIRVEVSKGLAGWVHQSLVTAQ